MSTAVAVDTTMTATVLRVRIVDRYAFGSACRRVTVLARLLPSSARLRIRILLTLVNEVSAAAANAATTRPKTMMTMSGVIGAEAGVGLSRSPEQFAHAASFVNTHDRLGDQRRDREDPQLGRIVEAVTAVVIRDRVGDADLVDGSCVKARHRAFAQDSVCRHHIYGLRTIGKQRDSRACQRTPRGDEVVDDHAGRSLNITDDVDHFHGVVARTAFVDDCDGSIEDARQVACAMDAARIR